MIKIEQIKELCRKMLVFDQNKKNVRIDELEEDHERVDLHVSLIDYLVSCARQNLFGIKQVRRIVNLDCLLDAILAQSVPFVIKRSYFRLLYVGYIQELGEIEMIDINFSRFIQVLKFVVLQDLSDYHQYYTGLVVKESELEES